MNDQPPTDPMEQSAPKPRRVAKRGPGSLFWQPKQPHPLDILETEVEALNAQIPESMERLLIQASTLQHHLHTLAAQDVPATLRTRDEQALTAIHQRFGMRKHLEHFRNYFAWLRRQHFLGLIRVSTAILTLANQFLQEILSGLQAPPIDMPSAPDEQPSAAKEELRLKGINDQPMSFVTNLAQSRRLIRQFEAQLPDLRRHLALGTGWFEIFELPKYHRKQILIDYLHALDAWELTQRPIPEEITRKIPAGVIAHIAQGKPLKKLPKDLREQVFDTTWIGPYARFRWQEGEHTYTISLGLIDDYPPRPFLPHGE